MLLGVRGGQGLSGCLTHSHNLLEVQILELHLKREAAFQCGDVARWNHNPQSSSPRMFPGRVSHKSRFRVRFGGSEVAAIFSERLGPEAGVARTGASLRSCSTFRDRVAARPQVCSAPR